MQQKPISNNHFVSTLQPTLHSPQVDNLFLLYILCVLSGAPKFTKLLILYRVLCIPKLYRRTVLYTVLYCPSRTAYNIKRRSLFYKQTLPGFCSVHNAAISTNLYVNFPKLVLTLGGSRTGDLLVSRPALYQ